MYALKWFFTFLLFAFLSLLIIELDKMEYILKDWMKWVVCVVAWVSIIMLPITILITIWTGF